MMTQSKGKGAAKVIPVSDELSPEPSLDRAIQERIGDRLRAMYDDLVHQPVPDRFVELLSRLEKRNDAGGK